MVIKRRRATYSTNSKRRRYKMSRNAKKVSSAIAYFKRKILVNENVSRGPDGYYTWLLKDIAGGRVLVAGHTRSQQELGTVTVTQSRRVESPPISVLDPSFSIVHDL